MVHIVIPRKLPTVLTIHTVKTTSSVDFIGLILFFQTMQLVDKDRSIVYGAATNNKIMFALFYTARLKRNVRWDTAGGDRSFSSVSSTF